MGVPYAEVIGDPIAHSRSPDLHRGWLAELGLAGDYRATRISSSELDDYLDLRRQDPDWRGCNVTRPLKQAMFERIDSAAPEAALILAVNTVTPGRSGALHGRNTDVEGVTGALRGLVEPGARIALIGAGGAARAAAFAIRDYSPSAFYLLSRRDDPARALLRDLGLAGEVLPIDTVPAVDLFINASPRTGPWDLSALRPNAVILDMVYQPVETELLQTARSMGFRCVDGLAMLEHQARGAFEAFFGACPPSGSDAAVTVQSRT